MPPSAERDGRKPIDATGELVSTLIIVPPLSPSDTNPPLGPYLLRTVLEKSGLTLDVCDLSISYLRQFGPSSRAGVSCVLGDQDKDRALIRRAKQHYLDTFPPIDALAVPCCSDHRTGMHVSFDGLDSAVREAASPGHCWVRFMDEHLFGRHNRPDVVGLSIMGPPQLFAALVAARMVKSRWPGTPVIAGGSHITLLATEIAADPRYGVDIDAFLPGHSEDQFATVVGRVRLGKEWATSPGVLVAGGGVRTACSEGNTVALSVRGRRAPPTFELLPTFSGEDLAPFDPARLTLPIQTSRGCAYGRCTMCTYPAAEPDFSGQAASDAVRAVIDALLVRHGVPRFSFKDSFMTPGSLRSTIDVVGGLMRPIEWSATTMLKPTMSKSLLRELAASGCRTLEYGLETIWEPGQRLFDKRQPMEMVEQVIADTAEAGIVANVNLIYGLPGETLMQACRQLEWFSSMQRRHPGFVTGSHNMLEINRGSPMAGDPGRYGIARGCIAPWSFSYQWDAPAWRAEFARELSRVASPPQASAAAA